MRVRLKGLNRVCKKLADGSTITYYYAWKGGPRLPGKPGDPEFIAAYNAAVAAKVTPPPGTLQSILNAYQHSTKWASLAPRTQKDYARHIREIEAEFSDFPIAALSDRRTRGAFLDWRDKLAEKSPRQADYALSTLAAILTWATDRGMTPDNPVKRPGKLHTGARVESVWSPEDEAAFMAVAPAHLRLAFLLAVWTGQRQGDLLRLTWTAYDGQTIRVRQSKGGRRVAVPVATPLRAALDSTPRRAVTILTTQKGTPWTSDGFRTSWGKVVATSGVKGLTFHDLRGTAVTRFAQGESTVPEIAAITGHSLRDVESILDAHYLGRTAALAESAVRKRERHESGT